MNYVIQSELNISLLHSIGVKIEKGRYHSIDMAIKVSMAPCVAKINLQEEIFWFFIFYNLLATVNNFISVNLHRYGNL